MAVNGAPGRFCPWYDAQRERPQTAVTIIAVTHHGPDSAEIVYKDAVGGLGARLLYCADAEQLEIVSATLPWSFTADGAAFRLVSEAYRIRLAYLFNVLINVHVTIFDPLSYQITVVYETMLNKQPLRYLLADDPETPPKNGSRKLPN